MPSEIVDHSPRVIAIQTGFWIIVLAAVVSAVGYGGFVTLVAAGVGATVLVSAVVLELTER
ncbi:hypothetical protein ABNG03_13040 [Halorubrum sp. RMP-47]|uniref:Uncharacterized protein n=1 Tax=Halorubrum miltondacostae TaxID=3076378 RepID=A0ABD5M584_9EURY